MKLNNEINTKIVKRIIDHMRRSGHSEEAILDTLKEKNYQIETILKADRITDVAPTSFSRRIMK